MRKMLLTGALVLFDAGTTPQVVTALTVCIAWFALIANLKPFVESVDDRLAQVEGLQVLFTLLIGLVLQLEAATDGDSGGMDDTTLGFVLIALNSIVVGLALIQQPIVRTIASRLARVLALIAAKTRAKRDWEKGWVVAPSDEAYRTALEGDEQGGTLALDVWCDVASHPPRVLNFTPLALSSAPSSATAKAWNFDSEGNVIVNPRCTTDSEGGETRWIDINTKRLLDVPPIKLFETPCFRGAVQWLDTEAETLLHAQPGFLVFKEPEAECETPHPVGVVVWRHRKDGRIVSVNPSTFESDTASTEPRPGDDGWSFAAMGDDEQGGILAWTAVPSGTKVKGAVVGEANGTEVDGEGGTEVDGAAVGTEVEGTIAHEGETRSAEH